MSSKNEDFKTTITKMVQTTSKIAKGKKSKGTKIATITRDVAITIVEPFSL